MKNIILSLVLICFLFSESALAESSHVQGGVWALSETCQEGQDEGLETIVILTRQAKRQYIYHAKMPRLLQKLGVLELLALPGGGYAKFENSSSSLDEMFSAPRGGAFKVVAANIDLQSLARKIYRNGILLVGRGANEVKGMAVVNSENLACVQIGI